jgi:putative transposase
MESRGRSRPVQQKLPFRMHGGRRKHGKRPRSPRQRSAPHRARPSHAKNHPVHVTLRGARRLPSLRKQTVFLAIRRALAKTWREWFRVVQFSVQTNHIHMIVEGHDRAALSRGMRGLTIRLARNINGSAGRRGNVFSDRYHARALKSPHEVRSCLVYVLLNVRKHLRRPAAVDPASSGFWFHGWKVPPASEPPGWRSDEPIPRSLCDQSYVVSVPRRVNRSMRARLAPNSAKSALRDGIAKSAKSKPGATVQPQSA